MGKICIERATGNVREWARNGMPGTYDAAIHDLLDAAEAPADGTRWNGTAWVPFIKTDAEKVADAAGEIDGQVLLKAIVAWAAQRFGVTPATARAEIGAIYKALV